jgi:integrase
VIGNSGFCFRCNDLTIHALRANCRWPDSNRHGPYARLSGNVTPQNYRELLDAAREGAAITDWPQNGLRHSFASYHLAKFNDAAALALELGHTNSNLVFQHYRQLVKPKQAERYWKIAPAIAGKKVVQFATA